MSSCVFCCLKYFYYHHRLIKELYMLFDCLRHAVILSVLVQSAVLVLHHSVLHGTAHCLLFRDKLEKLAPCVPPLRSLRVIESDMDSLGT